MHNDNITEFYEFAAGLLIRCFAFGFALLLYWFLFYTFAGDWVYRMHSMFYDISKSDFMIFNYYGMALVKILCFMFFLFPYFAIKLMLKSRRV